VDFGGVGRSYMSDSFSATSAFSPVSSYGRLVGCSLAAAFLIAVSAWLTLLAFGLPVSFVSGFVILGLITIGGMIPTPGAVGGFHAVCQFGN
jgi:hypothetical protein